MKKLTFIISLLLAYSSLSTYAAQEPEKDYHAPELLDPEAWSMIILPDPQTYSKFSRNQGIFDMMTAWIAENRDNLNIRMVLCVGDLVEQNDMVDPQGVKVNQTSREQWESVSGAFERLDNRVPYVAATGNHDYGFRNISSRNTHYPEYFNIERNVLNRPLLRVNARNADGVPSLENALYTFTGPGGKDYFVLVLEFAPRDMILEWADEMIAKPEYEDYTGILLTHSYLSADDQWIEHENYPIEEGNYGKAVWEKLVKPSKNIEMVFCGHIAKPDDIDAHVGFRVDENAAGKKVNQMLFNAQALGGGWYGNGGDGWLRILQFMPDGKTVKVQTFSPLFAISPTTQQFAWRSEPRDEFEFVVGD